MNKRNEKVYGQVIFRIVIKKDSDGTFIISAPNDDFDNAAVVTYINIGKLVADFNLQNFPHECRVNASMSLVEFRENVFSPEFFWHLYQYLNGSAVDDLFMESRAGHLTKSKIECDGGIYDDAIHISICKMFTHSELRSFWKKAYADYEKRTRVVSNGLKRIHAELASGIVDYINSVGAN